MKNLKDYYDYMYLHMCICSFNITAIFKIFVVTTYVLTQNLIYYHIFKVLKVID